MAYMDNKESGKQTLQGFRQFLSFTIADEDYGVDILRVQEIRGWEEIREIPNTPKYIKGVMNLRSQVVPVIDLRIRFGQDRVDYAPTTVIIVLSVEWDGQKHVVGVVVDAVSDVIDVNVNEIRNSPNFGTKVNIKFINGMIMQDKRMIVLLDVDKLLNPEEISILASMS